MLPLHDGSNVHVLCHLRISEEIRDIKRLVPAHQNIEMKICLGQNRDMRGLSNNLAFHEQPHRRMQSVQVTLQRQLEIILRLFPVLQSPLERILRIRFGS